jgi:3-hydroxyisobutyrate dehydrogenase-like beta-hydroxyacid dehydrogenase
MSCDPAHPEQVSRQGAGHVNDTSRRKFLAAAGAGAAAGTVGLAAPAAAAATRKANAVDEPVVAFVEDPRSAVVTLMFGGDEVVVEDRDLVVRILNAAGHETGRA